MAEKPRIGTVGWFDLTVDDAVRVRDFYAAVVGWKAEEVDMGGYQDFVMSPPGGPGVAGVCHARGTNSDLPAQWLMYVTVADLDASIAAVLERGGSLVRGAGPLGEGRYCVIRDPAGAVCALVES